MGAPGLLGLTARRSAGRARGEATPGGSGLDAGWEVRCDPRPPDTCTTPERTVAVIGSLRRPGGPALGAEDLVRAGVVGAGGIDAGALTGCGLVVSVERHRPVIHAYRTVLGVPQLYFHEGEGTLHASTSLRELLARTGPLAPDEDAAVEHFALRFVLAPRTCYRGVSKLPGGHLLTWRGGPVEHRRVARLTPALGEPFTRVTPESLAWLDAEMRRVTSLHAAAARSAGREPATLLSGGVDSTLLELWLEGAAPPPRRSCSFAAPDAGSFAAETRRARAAAARLGTDHLVVDVSARAYPDLLDRTVRVLARPSLFNEAWPCHLALADAVRERWGAGVTLFGGNAADGLHGVPELALVARRERWDLIPGLTLLARSALPLLARMGETGEGLAAVARLGDEWDPLRGPTSIVSLAGELPLLLECFGPDAVRGVFDRRRALAREAAPSSHRWERLQMVDLLTTGCEPSSAVADLHADRGIDVAMVYRDDEVAAAVASFDPSVRFLGDPGDGRCRLKPLQHGLLHRLGHGVLARVPKGGTTFWRDMWRWMGRPDGPLRERVMSIERPGFMSRTVFERVRSEPSDFLWNLLVYDTWRRTRAVLPERS